MALSPDRLYRLHDGLVRRCEIAGLTRSAETLGQSLDESIRARLQMSHRASDQERIEVQVRELLRMGWPDKSPRPPILDWLAAAARLVEGTRHAHYFREVHEEICTAYHCVAGRLGAVDDGGDSDEDDWDDDDEAEEDAWSTAQSFPLDVGDLEPDACVATTLFDLDEDSLLRVSLEADDLVDLLLVKDCDYDRWKRALLFGGDLAGKALWQAESEMFMTRESIDFDLEEDDDLEEYRLVVIHRGTEAGRVRVELELA